jgi:MraZ protein
MFRGLSYLALDGKGRLAVPARYRDPLQAQCDGRLIITLDPSSGCLLLYPLPEWEPIEKRLMSLPSLTNPVTRRMQQILVGSASEVDLDSAGRILLPAPLRDRAKLDKDIVLLGQGNKFEIWSATDWQIIYDAAADLPAQINAASQSGELPDELKDFSL